MILLFLMALWTRLCLSTATSTPPIRQIHDLCADFIVICAFVDSSCTVESVANVLDAKCIDSFQLFYHHNATLSHCVDLLPDDSAQKIQALVFLERYALWQKRHACELFHATEAKAALECSSVENTDKNSRRPWKQETWPLYCHQVFAMYSSTRHELDELCERTSNSEAFWEGYVTYIASPTCKSYYELVREAREKSCGGEVSGECQKLFLWYAEHKEEVERDCYELRASAEFVYYDFNGTTGLVLNGKAATSSCAPLTSTDYSTRAGADDSREATTEVVVTEQLEAIRLETHNTENHTTSARIAVETAMLGHRDTFQASEEKLRCPVRLRLTASQPNQVSSVWYAQQLPVLEGFETRFTFQITDQSRRCFEYNYVPNFSATSNLPKFIKDVSEGRRVGTLVVFMDESITTDTPILAIPINLAATLRLDSDEAFVPPCLDQYDTEMTFNFDYNEQSMLSTASHGNTLYPLFIYPNTASWAERQTYYATNQKVGLAS
ncbi:hypothetical protein BBO99_00006719 [Phytophthora kernoviae]|uniref:Uncharacterized protein n=2 Tax=Phytophthora kernoviae TaxID=325452 RepID=A0A3R7HG77_9STRA|nr:hypothetical protein G195_007738 [Phytophthora kernoviae 00238/432]KAG2520593.1 hypothetical protein JM16_006459 [Phytophthora kernoviae]KAG2521391.1 hypothetical protein JM18_006563 [Phytophthora kernoviae]RLN38281.1 hypothetical protein BBI17_006733 [Phytophthora kernoviae]RLN77478.1 hypothetical protein BBO99_00006719 [Phytophthora kernoviae]